MTLVPKICIGACVLAVSLSGLCATADPLSVQPQNPHFLAALSAEREQHFEQAVGEFKQAARQGHAASMERLAQYYFRGTGVEQDSVKTIWWLERSSEAGNINATYRLGQLLFSGAGSIRASKSYAVWWFEKAAQHGHIDAMVKVGEVFMTGDGTAVNMDKSIDWLSKASRLGSVRAQTLLADIYTRGINGEPDYAQSVLLLKQAVDRCYRPAYWPLAELYLAGQGVTPNVLYAYALMLAASDGQPLTAEHTAQLGQIRQGLSAQQQQQAQTLVPNLLQVDGSAALTEP